MSFLDRIPPATGVVGSGDNFEDEKFGKQFPAITEFLTVSVLGDGQTRTPSSITMFFEEGLFKLCLSERDRNLTLWATGPTLQDAFKTLEGRLSSPRPEWRRGRQQKGKGGR